MLVCWPIEGLERDLPFGGGGVKGVGEGVDKGGE